MSANSADLLKRVKSGLLMSADPAYWFGHTSCLCLAMRDAVRSSSAAKEVMTTLTELESNIAGLYSSANGGVELEPGLLLTQAKELYCSLWNAMSFLGGKKAYLVKVADGCDKAWPHPTSYLPPPSNPSTPAALKPRFGESGGTLGNWIACHCYYRKRGKLEAPRLFGTASTPVLFAGADGKPGAVAWLHVELIEGAGPLIPDIFSLGLTLLSRGANGFHESLQRA